MCTWVSEAADTTNRNRAAALGVCMSRYQQLGKLRSRDSYCADSVCLDPAADGIRTAHIYVRGSPTKGVPILFRQSRNMMRPVVLCLSNFFESICAVWLAMCKYVHSCCLDVLCVNVPTAKTQ